MKAKQLLGIAALATAASLGTSAYAADKDIDTFVKAKNATLTTMEQNKDYEVLIYAPWCGTSQLLMENMRMIGDMPTAEVQIQTKDDLMNLRKDLRTKGIDIPYSVPVMIDKKDGITTVYTGFRKFDGKAQMQKWDGGVSTPSDFVDLEKILE